jgi:hypothetical protein
METRPGTRHESKLREGRGSGPGVRKRRSDALGRRKEVMIRLPEGIARQLKVVAACEGMTIQDFCEQAILPQIQKGMQKHGLSAEQIAR